jgi:adenosylcobyric acid synthase
MHVGNTTGPATGRPLLRFADGTPDGAQSTDGRVVGTYVHGMFADDAQRAAWLARFGAAARAANHEAEIESALDALATHLEQHIDVDRLLSLAR